MSNLKLDCPSRSQEKWALKKWNFFQGLSFLQTNQRKIKFTPFAPAQIYFKLCPLRVDSAWRLPPEKYRFLFGMDFLVKEVASLTSNFTRRSASFLPNDAKDIGLRWMNDWLWGYWNQLLLFCLMFREAYNTGRPRFWYLSTEIHFIVLHVKFEDGMSSLENQDNSSQKLTVGNRKVSKKAKWVSSSPAHIISHPVHIFFSRTNSRVATSRDLAHWYKSEFSKIAGTYKSQSHGDGFK
jgi:hypothetical protein